jgi:hypothetical protein
VRAGDDVVYKRWSREVGSGGGWKGVRLDLVCLRVSLTEGDTGERLSQDIAPKLADTWAAAAARMSASPPSQYPISQL